MSSMTRIGWTSASAVKTSVPPMHTNPISHMGCGTRWRVVSHADLFFSEPVHIGQALEYRGQRPAECTKEGKDHALRSDPVFFRCIRFLAIGDDNRRAQRGRSNRPNRWLPSRQTSASESARSWGVTLGGLSGRLRREPEPPREPWE